ncbi:hypothetical protein [Rodentibacter haemolyticus]|uniref:Uncharacterized protein n=1 Tax=Rodentibacter haemolyticus TaxID=2778911 RepID=A0ABX6V054_9PAST|nr:hypothetical protein [Rodentibacter haemolyticus]QPB41691.1 hypothetical protein IHV77_07010 [Rodentibacter haemolyticus]
MWVNKQEYSQISSSYRLIKMTPLLRHRLNIESNSPPSSIYIDQEFFYKEYIDKNKLLINLDGSIRNDGFIKIIMPILSRKPLSPHNQEIPTSIYKLVNDGWRVDKKLSNAIRLTYMRNRIEQIFQQFTY